MTRPLHITLQTIRLILGMIGIAVAFEAGILVAILIPLSFSEGYGLMEVLRISGRFLAMFLIPLVLSVWALRSFVLTGQRRYAEHWARRDGEFRQSEAEREDESEETRYLPLGGGAGGF